MRLKGPPALGALKACRKLSSLPTGRSEKGKAGWRQGRVGFESAKPPSSSGLGRRPFKAVARVRIPLGVRTTEDRSMAQWRSWLARRPVTAEVAGSSPVWVAKANGIEPTLSAR